MKKQFVLLVIMLSFCFQGCAPIYIPSFGGKIEMQGGVCTSRDEIDNFLEIGKTSKEEIQSTWGNPSQILDRNIWVYKGLEAIGYGGYIQILTPCIEPLEIWPAARDILLFIKFDKNDCLKRYELQKYVCSNITAKNFVMGNEVRQQAIKWDKSFETQSK